VTYAAYLRDVEDTALDLIAIMTGSTPSSSDLTIAWPDEIESALTTINSAKQQAELAQQRAMDTMADAVVQLKSSGQSYRDIGAVLGISHQRVAQLLSSRKTTAEHSPNTGRKDHTARSA
jgi:DNA-binding CsgD family transcriptional regulator